MDRNVQCLTCGNRKTPPQVLLLLLRKPPMTVNLRISYQKMKS
nr:MAG TPA: hypothetical protein [Caudoviricetes sp.]